MGHYIPKYSTHSKQILRAPHRGLAPQLEILLMEEEKYWYVDPTTLEWIGPFTSKEEEEKFRKEDYEKYLEEPPTPTANSPLRFGEI